jgi:hypothetical protein
MADFVKSLFGGQKPAHAPVVRDDGMGSGLTSYLSHTELTNPRLRRLRRRS